MYYQFDDYNQLYKLNPITVIPTTEELLRKLLENPYVK